MTANPMHALFAPSETLAALIGSEPRPKIVILEDLMGYIRQNKLKDPADRWTVCCDPKLQQLVQKPSIHLMQLPTVVLGHLTRAADAPVPTENTVTVSPAVARLAQELKAEWSEANEHTQLVPFTLESLEV